MSFDDMKSSQKFLLRPQELAPAGDQTLMRASSVDRPVGRAPTNLFYNLCLTNNQHKLLF